MKNRPVNKAPSRIRFSISLTLACAVFVILGSLFLSNSEAQSSAEAFEFFNLTGTQKTQSANSIAGVSEQEIRINFDKGNFETAQKLRFVLLDGQTYVATRNESEGFVRLAGDEFTWRGKIASDNNWRGDLILTVKGRALAGLIYVPSGVYEIIPQKEFSHLLIKLDQTRFPACGGAIPVTQPEIDAQRKAPELTSPASLIEPSAGADDDGSLIDVMVVYTAPVRQALGGTTQTQAFIQQAIAVTNTTYQNSNINPRVRLVQTMEVNYAESGTLDAALNWVRNDAMVAAARNTAKADMVSIIVENATDFCGLAPLMSTVSTSFAPNAFSAVARGCVNGNLTLPHELGHNQGCHHNPENASGPVAYPYAYGHYSTGGNFTSVMSYSNFCAGCVRAPHFSNPSIFYNGFSTGITNQRENFRVINNTANTVANFRESGGGGGCQGTAISVGQTVNGSLLTSDCVFTGTTRYVDVYTFNGTAGQTVSVSMNSSAFDTYLYLLNSGNQTLAEDDDGGGGTNSRIPASSGFFTLPATGTYSIYATSFSANSTGAYSLTLSGGGGGCQATPISVGQTVNNSLLTSDCVFTGTTRYVDLYNFSGAAGQSVYITMGSPAFDTYLYLVNSSNQTVAEDDDGGGGTNSRIPATSGFFTLPATGSYTIYATSFSAGLTGSYTLFLGSGTVPTSRKPYDFDNDGRSDVSVFRPANGTWYLSQSSAGFAGTGFGANGDRPAPADYDGDGRTDLAVFRPSTGTWYLLRSQLGFMAFAFGANGDLPASGDFDGDGKADIAVFRPSTGVWYIQRSQLGFLGFAFGANGDVPVTGDYDGDGKADIAVFRQSNGTWYIQRSQLGFAAYAFGSFGDKPVPGDYDGDNKTDVAVWRPASGTWYVQRSQLGFFAFAFGQNGDKPAPGDFDGDGKTDCSIFRPSNGTWYIQRSQLGFFGQAFGANGDIPAPGAYVP